MLLIANGSILRMAGGDYHLFKAATFWRDKNDIQFIIPSVVFNYVSSLFPDKVVVSSSPLERKTQRASRAIAIYTLRIFRSLFFNFNKEFDVIIASSHYPHDVVPGILQSLKNRRAKLVIYVHGMFPEVPATNGPFLRTVSLVYNYLGGLLALKFAKRLFVFNVHTQTYFGDLGAKKESIKLSSNAAELHCSRSFSQQIEFDASFLGRVVPSKGIFDMVRVWKKVTDKKTGSKLVIMGSGMINELMRAAKKEGVSQNIVVTGHLDEEKKYEVLAKSRVFLFPSYTEGWGIAVAEAMACGLPVVAYKLPIYREVFENRLLTVPIGDIDAMASAVINLLENPSVAVKMGQENKEFVKRYEWKSVAENELDKIVEATKSGNLKN